MSYHLKIREHENSIAVEGSKPHMGGEIAFHFDDAYMNRDELVLVYEGDEVACYNTWEDKPNKLQLRGLNRGYMSVSLDPLAQDDFIEAVQEWVGEDLWDDYHED